MRGHVHGKSSSAKSDDVLEVLVVEVAVANGAPLGSRSDDRNDDPALSVALKRPCESSMSTAMRWQPGLSTQTQLYFIFVTHVLDKWVKSPFSQLPLRFRRGAEVVFASRRHEGEEA